MATAAAKTSTAPKAFGGSDTDRRVSGVADRRVNLSTYVFNEYPKMVFHKDGKQSRIVQDETQHDALGADWGHDVPEVHKDDETHEAAVLKGDGIPRNQNVQKVEVVNPKDDSKAAAFQQPAPATAADESDAAKKAHDAEAEKTKAKK